MTAAICKTCGQPEHWCDDCGEELTGHYGKTPAKLCDDCRHKNIMTFGVAGDEPIAQLPKVLAH